MRTADAFGSGAVALKKCYYGKLIPFCNARIVLCFSPDLVYNGPTLSTVYVVFFALPVARLRRSPCPFCIPQFARMSASKAEVA